MGNLAGWPYWKVISITGQAGAGTDYQTKLTIGDSAGGDFHLEGHCTNFPQDIRITDDDGTTLLDHWVEDITADPIVVHVEVKDDLGSNQDVRVYYGKNGETTASDIDTTFLFGDSFPGSSLDTDKWDITDIGSLSITISNGEYRGQVTGAGNSGKIYSKNLQFGSPIAAKFRWKGRVTEKGLIDVGFRNNDASRDIAAWVARDDQDQWFTDTRNDGTSTQSLEGTTGSGTYQTWDILWKSSSEVEYFREGVSQQVTTSNVPDESNLHFSIFQAYLYTNSDSYLDWVAVRKYNSPEPAFASAGAEQTPPVTGHPWYYRRNQ